MRGFLSWLVTFLALSVLLTLSGLNLGFIPVDLSPVHAPVSLPLFAVILGAAAIGFLWGVLVTWLAASEGRAEIRRLRRDLDKAQAEITAVHTQEALRHPDQVTAGLLPAESSPHRWWQRK